MTILVQEPLKLLNISAFEPCWCVICFWPPVRLVEQAHVTSQQHLVNISEAFDMKVNIRAVTMAALLVAGIATSAQATIVFANGAAPGDAYTNASTSNQGQAVGSSGWYYNNVRNGGVAGIDNSFARSGNGSVHMSGVAGPVGSSFKADIEYLANGTAVGGNYYANGSLGLFSTFTGMSYDWYRSSSSTNNAGQHPALRILLDLDGNLNTTGDRGGLVYELAYNGGGSVATDTWVSAVVDASTKLWNFGLGLGNEFDIDLDGTPYDLLSEWQSSGRLANAVILGFSAGVGSGWGPFDGAVDNIAWTIDGVTTTTNFEVAGAAVPEPASLALVGLALGGLAMTRRRKPT
jgi:hypothetical protein